jgi:hypothetical protein
MDRTTQESNHKIQFFEGVIMIRVKLLTQVAHKGQVVNHKKTSNRIRKDKYIKYCLECPYDDCIASQYKLCPYIQKIKERGSK